MEDNLDEFFSGSDANQAVDNMIQYEVSSQEEQAPSILGKRTRDERRRDRR